MVSWSRKITDGESEKDTTPRECLAGLISVLLLWPNPQHTCFILEADHDVLQLIINLANATCEESLRWRLRLFERALDAAHRTGIRCQATNALSWLSNTSGRTVSQSKTHWRLFWSSPDQKSTREQAQKEVMLLTTRMLMNLNSFLRDFSPWALWRPLSQRQIQLHTSWPDCEPNRSETRFAGKWQWLSEILAHFSPMTTMPSEFAPSRLMVRYRQWWQTSSSTPPLPLSLSKTGGAPRRAWHVCNYETRALLSQHGQPYLHKSRWLTWIRQKLGLSREESHLKMFPANGHLEFIATDILGPLPKTTTRNQIFIVNTAWRTKLALAIPSWELTAPQGASIISHHRVVPFWITATLFTDNGPKFISKVFKTPYPFFGTKHWTATAYNPQTNVQAERYKKTIVARLHHYVTKQQRDWDPFESHSHTHTKAKKTKSQDEPI